MSNTSTSIITPTADISVTLALLAAQGYTEVELASDLYPALTPLVVPAGFKLIGSGSKRTRIDASAISGSADSPTNAWLKVQGSANTTLVNTTLAVTAPLGSMEITVTSPTNITVGSELVLRGNNNADDAYSFSDGVDIILTELVTVVGIAGPVLSLARPLSQHHAIGISVLGGVPLEDVHLEGFSIDGGTGLANGVLADFTVGLTIKDLAGSNLSRAIVEARLGTADFDISELRNDGAVNSMLYSSSAMRGRVRDVLSTGRGDREHSLGIPRGLLTCRDRCTDISFEGFSLRGGNIGLRTWGGVQLHYRNGIITDMRPDQAIARDSEISGGQVGSCVDCGAGPLNIAEFGFDNTWEFVHAFDARVPDPSVQYTWYRHDQLYSKHVGCSIVNRGVDPNLAGYYMSGELYSDTSGLDIATQASGVHYGLRTQGAICGVDIIGRVMSGSAGDGSPAANGVYINTGGGNDSEVRIHSLVLDGFNGLFRFGSAFAATTDWHFRIDKLSIGGKLFYGGVLGYNDTGVTFAVSDAVEMLASSPAGMLFVGTAAAANPRTAVVAVGGPFDVGTGFMVVVPLPTGGEALMTVSGAVSTGDYIESNNARQGVVQATPSFSTCARALAPKASGVGTVRVGPK